MLNCLEALYGGAAGGGKSDALLMAALQYVDIPGYTALLLRRTYTDLMLPDALLDRAAQWLSGTDATWIAREKTWLFPSGARLVFGYLEYENHKYRYQSSAFQFIGFDELTQFTESQYRYLFSRLRRLEGVNLPLRMRAATNPGGIGHLWVKRRFLSEEGRKAGRIFIPALLTDNPYLDQDSYRKSLENLDPVTRRQLLNGDWDIAAAGNMFKREWFGILPHPPAEGDVVRIVRYWDLAGTIPSKRSSNPDRTVGTKMALLKGGGSIVLHVVHLRGSPMQVERVISQTANIDGKSVPIVIEQEGGASGKAIIDHYRRNVLNGWEVRADKPTGSKEARARPYSAACESGLVKLVAGRWNEAFLDEHLLFPSGPHDDFVDSAAGAFNFLHRGRGVQVVGYGGKQWT